MEKTTIMYAGQIVDCYGEWKWDSNAIVCGYYEDGTELEEIFADGADDWYDAVQKLVDCPALRGCEIVELQAC